MAAVLSAARSWFSASQARVMDSSGSQTSPVSEFRSVMTEIGKLKAVREGLATEEAVDLYWELAEHMPELYGPATERAAQLLALLSDVSEA